VIQHSHFRAYDPENPDHSSSTKISKGKCVRTFAATLLMAVGIKWQRKYFSLENADYGIFSRSQSSNLYIHIVSVHLEPIDSHWLKSRLLRRWRSGGLQFEISLCKKLARSHLKQAWYGGHICYLSCVGGIGRRILA
jgi:hypothetical protein